MNELEHIFNIYKLEYKKELLVEPILICGKSGPTGKTTLCKRLKKLGFNAIEISESLCFMVDYRSANNKVFYEDEYTLICLNKRGLK